MRTAATDLAYAGPDPLASSLRQGRVGTVAVVVEGPLRYAFHDPFALAILDGLAEESTRRAARCCSSPSRSTTPSVRWHSSRPRRSTQQGPAVWPPREPARRPPARPRHPSRGQRRPRRPTRHPRAHRRAGGDAAHHRARARARPHPGRAPVDAPRPVLPTGPVTDADLAAAAYPDAAVGSRGSARSPVATPPSSRRTTSRSRPGEERSGRRADVPAALSGRPPSSPRPTCARPGRSAPPSRSGLRVPEDLSVTGFDGVELPWLDHVVDHGRAAGRGEGTPPKPACPPHPRRAWSISDEHFGGTGRGWGRRRPPHPLRHVLTEPPLGAGSAAPLRSARASLVRPRRGRTGASRVVVGSAAPKDVSPLVRALGLASAVAADSPQRPTRSGSSRTCRRRP